MTTASVPAPRPSGRIGPLDAVAWAGMFAFGIVMALLGATMPVLSGRFSLGFDDVGTLFLVTNGAMLAASLVVGPVMDKYGLKGPLTLGAAMVAGALVGVAVASTWHQLLPAVACLGFGGGILNAGTNTLVADLHEDPEVKASALNVLGVFFGIGALFLPFAIGALLSSVGLFALLVAAGAVCAGTAAATLALRYPPPKQAGGNVLAQMPRLLRERLVVVLGLAAFFESGNEFMLGGYFATFLTTDLRAAVGTASYLLALFWACIMVSRLLLSRLVLRFSPSTILSTGALLAGAGSLIVAVAPSIPVAIAGIVVSGFALAGVFPTLLGIAGSAFRERSGTVFGVLFTFSLTGGMSIPWLAGQLAAAAGIRWLFVLTAVDFVAVVFLSRLARPAR